MRRHWRSRTRCRDRRPCRSKRMAGRDARRYKRGCLLRPNVAHGPSSVLSSLFLIVNSFSQGHFLTGANFTF